MTEPDDTGTLAAVHSLNEARDQPIDPTADEFNRLSPGRYPARLPDAQCDRWIDRETGLLAQDLATHICQEINVGVGVLDRRLYVYLPSGVWVPDQDDVLREICYQLGNRYRPAHTRTLLDLISTSHLARPITHDPQPDLINVRNGMLDWRTGELLPHDPAHGSTVQLAVDYDPEAECPEVDKFLADVLLPDCLPATDETAALGATEHGFIWELIAYLIYSGNPFHTAVLLQSSGRSGKGTLLRVLTELISKENTSAVTLKELTSNKFRSSTLYGKIINVAGDIDASRITGGALFKRITGGDSIQAERKNGQPFDFTPWAVPVYSINGSFTTDDTSVGWTERWVVVPFPRDFANADKDRMDPGLTDRLITADELCGVLRKAAAALPVVMARERLPQPESIRLAKERFVASTNDFLGWVAETLELDGTARETKTEVKLRYHKDTSQPMSDAKFKEAMELLPGVKSVTVKGKGYWKGVRLRSASDSETE